jgi:hypothetical protein
VQHGGQAHQPAQKMEVCFGEATNRATSGFAGLAPLHMLALDRHLVDDLAILVDLPHGQAQHLTYALAHLQHHFEVTAIAQRIATAEALPDQR